MVRSPFRIVLALLALSVVDAGATSFPAEGYRGARQAIMRCEPGSYLVGLRGRIGDWVDAMGGFCRKALPGGHFAERSKKGVPIAGGSGGNDVQLQCKNGQVIPSVSVYVSHTDRTLLGVQFDCRIPGDTSGLDDRWFLSERPKPESWVDYYQKCPNGEAAVGYQINYGKHVNGFGLICEPFAFPASVEPQQEPAPQNDPAPVVAVGPSPFIGVWNMVSSNGRTYMLVLNVTENNRVNGEFITDDQNFSGVMKGKIDGNGREFLYTFTRHDGEQGSGMLTLGGDNRSISGGGGSTSESFTWGGEKTN